MTKRILAIGVGGSGKAALTILKERLDETYGQVPDNVVLLSLDTDDLRDGDTFAGTKLTTTYDERKREPEFRQFTSKAGVTMSTIFADMVSGKTLPYMYWLEREKLQRRLGPSEMDIRGGAQQRRPVGRVAVFQRWDNPIYSSIIDAIVRVYGNPDEDKKELEPEKVEQSKRLVFLIGSVAGGTGSGSLVDTANLIRHAINSNSKWQSIDVSAIVVLPDAFSSYTTKMEDPTNLKPNSYAALRELDRFVRTHSAALPYMIRYGEDIRSITWSITQPLDHLYLVDTASPSAVGEADLSGDPLRGVFPVIADFVMAHVDASLGDSLATLRSNAGQHYDKEEGWQYSSFNIMSYIFPVEDVIRSFSYRYLRHLMAMEFLPIADAKQRAPYEKEAIGDTERMFLDGSIAGKVNPMIIQKAVAATRPIEPELPDSSTWTGLFNLISLSDTGFAEDRQNLQQWLDHIAVNMVPTKEGEYKNESYDEGFNRLLNLGDFYMNECLGRRIDDDNEDLRSGGSWDGVLGRYRDALRLRFAEALDVALLTTLNRRNPETKVLEPARLPTARVICAELKRRLVAFKKILLNQYADAQVDTRLRHSSEELRNAIAWMSDARERTFAWPFMKSEAYKAQKAYIGYFREKMERMLLARIFKTVIDVVDTLGAEEKDQDENSSIVDIAALELENWQATYQEVDKILYRIQREHEKNREEKRQVKVRHYLTDKDFENRLYNQPEHAPTVNTRVLGVVRGQVGMNWKRVEDSTPLDFRVVTAWTEQANGAEEIARSFFQGIKGLFKPVREHVTVAERLQTEISSSASFVNMAGQINEPYLRYNPALNGKTMFQERFISFNLSKSANDAARTFLEEVRDSLRNQGVNVDTSAESVVACTILEISRGVKLRAVEQFVACEPDYRAKLHAGRESLHLFPEEQCATDYENRIETLGEPDNKQRPLAPELVIALGDETKLKTFVLACAYGVIQPGLYIDPASQAESTEIFLHLEREDSDTKEVTKLRLPLSSSSQVRRIDKHYDLVPAESQVARLYLNALQNFVLLGTQKLGVPDPMVAILVEDLKRRGVVLDHLKNPFTLSIREIGEQTKKCWDGLGGPKERADHLQAFVRGKVSGFKKNSALRISDMGTVMHLILKAEINRLRELSR